MGREGGEVSSHGKYPAEPKVVNEQKPERFPTRPMGNIPVLARLVLEGGTERWQVALANRWTARHVLVVWQSDPSDPHSSQLCWLKSDDVVRSLSGSTEDLAPRWERMRG